jgi:hypothetical protein
VQQGIHLALQVSVQIHRRHPHQQQQGNHPPQLAPPQGRPGAGSTAAASELCGASAGSGEVGWARERGEWGHQHQHQQGLCVSAGLLA